jgi:hypothetical protein
MTASFMMSARARDPFVSGEPSISDHSLRNCAELILSRRSVSNAAVAFFGGPQARAVSGEKPRYPGSIFWRDFESHNSVDDHPLVPCSRTGKVIRGRAGRYGFITCALLNHQHSSSQARQCLREVLVYLPNPIRYGGPRSFLGRPKCLLQNASLALHACWAASRWC